MATDDTPREKTRLLQTSAEKRAAELEEANATLMRELAECRRAAERLAENTHTLEARLTERTAEFGEIHAKLMHEVEERTEMEEAFRKMNELLEATIEERTADLRDKLLLIEQQQETLLLLSTPVIRIWDGVLVLPLIGMIDALRAAQIMESSLAAIAQHRARIFIIDITGTPFVNAEVAEYLIRTARAAGLLGVHCMLVGISPKVAEALVQSGADLGRVATFGALQNGLEEAFRRMRYKVART
jgi:rsbT co-antagonist protein RsbR